LGSKQKEEEKDDWRSRAERDWKFEHPDDAEWGGRNIVGRKKTGQNGEEKGSADPRDLSRADQEQSKKTSS